MSVAMRWAGRQSHPINVERRAQSYVSRTARVPRSVHVCRKTNALIIYRLLIMIKTNVYQFNPVKLIEEVKKRPGLYSLNQPAERDEKLQLWKEIGAALYADWDNFNKATAYDRGW